MKYLVNQYGKEPKSFDTLEEMENHYSEYELIEATAYGDLFSNKTRRYIVGAKNC